MSFGIPVRNGLGVGLLASTSLSSLRIGGRPAMSLDFINTNSLDSRVTFTRALNTATVENANGSVSIVNANLPRFDFANGICRGLLIEESRTNLLLNSVFSGAVAGTPGTPPTDWSNLVTTGTIASVTAGIYAAGNAVRITNTGTRRAFFKSYALSANTTYAYSTKITVHSAPNVGFPRIQDCMNLSGGPVGSTVTYLLNGVAATATTVIPNGQTSTVVAIIAVSVLAGNVEVRWGLGINSVVDGDVSIQMPQLEAGAFATSYIPTTTLAVTRNADNAVMTGTNFSSWYNQSEGTFVINLTPVGAPTGAANTRFLEANDGTANNRKPLLFSSGTGVVASQYRVAGADQAFLSSAAGVFAPNVNLRIATAYAVNDFGASYNGATAVTDNSGSISNTATQLTIGYATSGAGSEIYSGHIRFIAYYNTRLPNTTLRALSA